MTNIERLPTEQFLQLNELRYSDHFGLHKIYPNMRKGSKSLIISGPKGVGKSLSVLSYAQKNTIPTVVVDCSEDLRRSQLIGSTVLRGDRTPFVLGPIPTAIEVANEIGDCILLFEEINALTPQMQKLLNPITDFRKSILVPECNSSFSLNESAKLWVVGTMNPHVYGGTYSLNEDLISRFRVLRLGYPARTAELEIIQSNTNIDAKLADKIITLAEETRQPSIGYSLSTRDLIALATDIHDVGIQFAMQMLLGKFEEEEAETLSDRIRSIFGYRP